MTAALGYDPMDPALRADPYPAYQKLREQDPVHRSEAAEAWVVTRHADAVEILRGSAWGNDHRNATTERSKQRRRAVEAGQAPDTQGKVLLFMDPPDHTRVRSIVASAFTPRMVEGLRPMVTELVTDLLDQALEAGTVDLMSSLAFPLPVAVIAELLGIPASDLDWFRERSARITPLLDWETPPDALMAVQEAGAELAEYFDRLVEGRRSDPRDDLVSALVAAHDEGDRLDQVELITMCMLLLIAGHETTMNLIGNGTLALLAHRDQFPRLARDPGLAVPGVEELLRYDSSVQLTARTALEDTEIAGTSVTAGEQALVLLGAANRDPARFHQPDSVLLDRPDNHHLAFSHGRHFCLGAALARLEGQVAFTALARRAPGLELAGDLIWRDTVTLRGLTALPVRLR